MTNHWLEPRIYYRYKASHLYEFVCVMQYMMAMMSWMNILANRKQISFVVNEPFDVFPVHELKQISFHILAIRTLDSWPNLNDVLDVLSIIFSNQMHVHILATNICTCLRLYEYMRGLTGHVLWQIFHLKNKKIIN